VQARGGASLIVRSSPGSLPMNSEPPALNLVVGGSDDAGSALPKFACGPLIFAALRFRPKTRCPSGPSFFGTSRSATPNLNQATTSKVAVSLGLGSNQSAIVLRIAANGNRG
jgi:hypothetical protein